MDADLLQATIDIVFKGNLLYLAPFIFLLMVILVADRFIDLIVGSIKTNRRSRY
ncbi:hypothetical protein [Paraliobacillus sp. X-1268]|uniref:hypothetical protein n=1 Tax=Paraliobacillus sp. X-1268 TaxID=2213193 RepID=UPI0018E51A83|nr:hypothetical protein [Paraliobacillus sp. X-1268]